MSVELQLFIYFVGNLGLYLFGIIYNVLGLVFAKHYKLFIKFAYWFTGFLLIFTFYGLYEIGIMFELQERDAQFSKLYDIMITMICIRLFFYSVICSFFGCMSIAVCCAIASGQQHIIT